jgi:hypothetical protein
MFYVFLKIFDALKVMKNNVTKNILFWYVNERVNLEIPRTTNSLKAG